MKQSFNRDALALIHVIYWFFVGVEILGHYVLLSSWEASKVSTFFKSTMDYVDDTNHCIWTLFGCILKKLTFENFRYNISGEEFSPYFSLGNCMEGLNIVLKSLYDVTLQNVEPQNGELWSDEVYKLVHSFSSILCSTILCIWNALEYRCWCLHCLCDNLTAAGCIWYLILMHNNKFL